MLPAGSPVPAPAGTGRGWVRRLGPFVRRHRSALAGAVAASVTGQLAFGLVPLVQQVVVDEVIVARREPLAPWVGALLLLGALHFLLTFVRRFLGGRFAFDVQHDLQLAVHRHAQRLDLAAHQRFGGGELMTRATADVSLVGGFLSHWNVIAGNLVQLSVALTVMLLLSPALTVVVAVALPAFMALANRYRRRVFPASWDDQRVQARVGGVVDEAVSGVRVVKAFGQEERELGRLDAAARALFASRMRTARITGRYTAGLRLVPGLAQPGVLALGGWLVIGAEVSLGTFLAFASYLVQLVGPVRMLSGAVITAQQARAGAVRVLEVLDHQPGVADAPGAVVLPRGSAGVEFRDVTFGHPGRPRPVLDSCTFTVRPGERVAVVGASGSGKSTVAALLARFHDVDAGSVRVGGRDVREVTVASLRRAVGLVFEDSYLFCRSIRDNVTLGRPDASDAEVHAALAAAGADGFVDALPDGLDSPVGEGGLALSGGQRQRLALARTLLADPDVLVLDDATSAVDATTEADIHRRLGTLLAGRTTILLAHRRSTLELAERVVVLSGGRVLAQGGHEQLLRTCPAYRALLGEDAPADDGAPDTGPPAVTDRRAWPPRPDGPDGRTPRSPAPVSLGPTGDGGGGATPGFNRTFANAGLVDSTPELLAAVERLPPATDDPAVDVRHETAPRPPGAFTLRELLRPFRPALALTCGFVLVEALVGLAGPLSVRHGVDAGMAHGSYGVVLAAAGALGCFVLAGWANTWAMTVHSTRTAERVLYALRLRSFAHLQRLSLDYYEREMSGRIFARMTADVEAVSKVLSQGLVVGATSIASSVGIAAVTVALAPGPALAVAALIPPAALVTVVFRRASRRAYAAARERVALVYAELAESLDGVRVAQALRAEAAGEDRFAGRCAHYREARLRSMRLSALFFPFVQMLSIAAKAVAFAVGAPLVVQGELSAGVLIAFLLYLDQFFTPVQQLSATFDEWLAAGSSLERISELLDTPSGTPAPARPAAVGRLGADIRLSGVRFAYRDGDDEALRGVDLHVPAGQRVALVGSTGAGKSTLVKLVTRFYDPTAGTVHVDGRPLACLDLAGYRRQLGYVPQEPVLFTGSVRDNIAYGRPDATDLEVERAARRIGAHHMVAGLPDGYHTAVTRAGRSLSAGQRQLICLARAELVDPAILVLDEATANLDLAAEAAVQRGMSRAAHGRTTLLIAHRLQTTRIAQRVVVVEDGLIVEDGTHADLLDAGGRYARLWAAAAPQASWTSRPSTSETSASDTAPARSTRGCEPVRSTTVDATGSPDGPPSR